VVGGGRRLLGKEGAGAMESSGEDALGGSGIGLTDPNV
jgi:hypothetical protein